MIDANFWLGIAVIALIIVLGGGLLSLLSARRQGRPAPQQGPTPPAAGPRSE